MVVVTTLLGPVPSVILPREGTLPAQVRPIPSVVKLDSIATHFVQTIGRLTKVAHPITPPIPPPPFTLSSRPGIPSSIQHSTTSIVPIPTATSDVQNNNQLGVSIVPDGENPGDQDAIPSPDAVQSSDAVPSPDLSPQASSHGTAIAIGDIGYQATITAIGTAHPQSAAVGFQDATDGSTTTAPQQTIDITDSAIMTYMAETLADSTATSSEPLATGTPAHQDNSVNIRIIIPAVVVPLVVAVTLGLYLLWSLKKRRRTPQQLMAASKVDPCTVSVVWNPTQINQHSALKDDPAGQGQQPYAASNPGFDHIQARVAPRTQPCQPEMTRRPILSISTTNLNSLSELERGTYNHNLMNVPPSCRFPLPQEPPVTHPPSIPTTEPKSNSLKSRISRVFSQKARARESMGSNMTGTDTQLLMLKEKVEWLEAAVKEGSQRRIVEAPSSVDVELGSDGLPAYTSDGNIVVSEKQLQCSTGVYTISPPPS